MNIVQSGLSASIRSLEQELGLTLLVRTTRRVDLTEAGRAFLIEVRRVHDALQGARAAVESVKGMVRGTVHIGTMQRLSPLFDLPAILARFRAEHPEVEIRLRQAGSASLMKEVADGRLDFAFLSQFGDAPRGLAMTPLGEDPLVFACSSTHPLAGRSHVSLATIAGESFVDFEGQWGLRVLVDRAFGMAQLDRRIAFELNDVPTMLDLVRHGLGVAVVPRFVAAETAGVTCVPIDPTAGVWRLALARRDRHPLGPAARALINLILPAGSGDPMPGATATI